MKKIISAVVFLLFSAAAYSQVVNIPDVNFKNYLVNNFGINTNTDGEIQVSEAAAYSGAIVVDEMNIYDLTGIEAFTSISSLHCHNNFISTLNLTNNNRLDRIFCYHNQLNLLDISNNERLKILNCAQNLLTSLDVSNNDSLKNFDCSSNLLTSLEVSNLDSLEMLFCGYNNLTSLDVSENTALRSLNIRSANIDSININNCPNLTFFDSEFNPLSSLDVSHNPLLYVLQIRGNHLTSLDVSANPELTYLYIPGNNFSSLDITHNPLLTQLYISGDCGFNSLITSLDLSQNTLLETIHISYMPLLHEVCVWETPFPPSTVITLDTVGSPDLFFTSTCSDIVTVTTESENNSFTISPNPLLTQTTLQTILPLQNATLALYNIAGQKVKQLNNVSGSMVTINRDNLTAGIYFLQVQQENEIIAAAKLVIADN